MRITPELLLKIAKDKADEFMRNDRGILAAYLCGSLLTENPLLGGATDVDLVLVHNETLSERREIVALTDEVHLDILHHDRSLYRQPKALRLDAWLGPTLYTAKVLHDPQHFLDFVQASVRGQFHRPDNILARANALAAQARQLWLSFNLQPDSPLPAQITTYLNALETAANAIASLSGPPLTTRRLLAEFPQRASAIGHAGLSAGLFGLLGGPTVETEILRAWLTTWDATLQAIAPHDLPPQLHPARWAYYRQGIEALLSADHPLAALWPLLMTWTQAIGVIPQGDTLRAAWEEALARLGLVGAAFSEKLIALDAYLDTVEEALEEWGRANGA